jgi:hypothetical protein
LVLFKERAPHVVEEKDVLRELPPTIGEEAVADAEGIVFGAWVCGSMVMQDS